MKWAACPLHPPRTPTLTVLVLIYPCGEPVQGAKLTKYWSASLVSWPGSAHQMNAGVSTWEAAKRELGEGKTTTCLAAVAFWVPLATGSVYTLKTLAKYVSDFASYACFDESGLGLLKNKKNPLTGYMIHSARPLSEVNPWNVSF